MELMESPLTVPNVPVSELKFIILKVFPTVGTKPVGRAIFSVPLSLAEVGLN